MPADAQHRTPAPSNVNRVTTPQWLSPVSDRAGSRPLIVLDRPSATRGAGRVGKLVRLVRTFRNWPRVLVDHLQLSRRDYVCRLHDGTEFEVRGGTDDRHVLFEVFVQSIYPVRIAPGAVVLDIGANVGAFAVLAARAGARVYAFEPFPANFARLSSHAERNAATSAGTVVPIHAAVSDRAGAQALFVPSDPGHLGRFSLHPGRGAATVQVRCVTLADVCQEYGLDRLDLVKLDCQGSEYEILYSTSRSVLSRIHAIVMECELGAPGSPQTPDAMQAFLAAGGFIVHRHGHLLYATRPT